MINGLPSIMGSRLMGMGAMPMFELFRAIVGKVLFIRVGYFIVVAYNPFIATMPFLVCS